MGSCKTRESFLRQEQERLHMFNTVEMLKWEAHRRLHSEQERLEPELRLPGCQISSNHFASNPFQPNAGLSKFMLCPDSL